METPQSFFTATGAIRAYMPDSRAVPAVDTAVQSTLASVAPRTARLIGRSCVWLSPSKHIDVREALESAGITFVDAGRATEWAILVIDAANALTADSFAAAAASPCSSLLVMARASDSAARTRETVDRAAIAAGFRRHPLLFTAAAYAEIEHEHGWILVPLERLPEPVATRFPLEWLARARDLHMDMTREEGRRSDAHLARYGFASTQLPKAGRVLDAACGLGYGTALLSREAPDRQIVGVDIDPSSVEYAALNFGAAGRLAFETHDVVDLSRFPSNSFDAVVSFETVEHVADAPGFLRELHRVMKDGAMVVASVPYRWFIGADLGPYHADWYDAGKLIRLFSRFFIIDGMWRQTAGGADFCRDEPRTWNRLQTLGAEPPGPAEWLVVTARRAEIRQMPGNADWVFLAPGVPQLSTMLATMRERKIDPHQVTIWGCSPLADDGFHTAMRETSTAFGTRYGGNLFIAPDLWAAGDPLEFDPGDTKERQTCQSRITNTHPILQSLRGGRLMMPARPDVPADYALVVGAAPAELHLVADGIQNHLTVRDFSGAPGFPDNALAHLPTTESIGCPPWLETEVAAIGRAAVLPERTCRGVLADIGRIPGVAALTRELSDADRPFSAVVVSQHFSSSGLTSMDAELVFYLHQIRTLLQRTQGRVLFKAHPRDPHGKLEALAQAFGPEAARVRLTRGVENHIPLEAFPLLAHRSRTLLVWGTSSTALVGVRGWSGAEVNCIDADYIEPEIRRQALQFSRRHTLPLVTLQFADRLLDEPQRCALRRRMIPSVHSPAIGASIALRDHVATLEQTIVGLEQQSRELRRELRAVRVNGLERLTASIGAQRRALVIWGAGSAGRRAADALPTPISAFVDSNRAKTGTVVNGTPVVAPDALETGSLRDAFIVVASVHAREITGQLAATGRVETADFVVLDFDDLTALEARREEESPRRERFSHPASAPSKMPAS